MSTGSISTLPIELAKVNTENIKSHKKAWTYLLRCSDNTLYCGSTTDIERRVTEHNSPPSKLLHKGAKYTRGRQPVVLAWIEEHVSLSLALKREYQVKQMDRAQKEALLRQ